MISAQNGGTSGTYSYDGDGTRLSSVSGGITRNYLWDVNGSLPALAVERSGSSTLRDYAYGVDLNSMTTSGSNYFYLEDAYGSIADVTSVAGATEWTYSYDAFGNDAGTTKVDPSAPANPMRFDGQLSDALTGLYYMRARIFDPNTGRFLQIDPIPRFAGAPYASSYVYVDDRPTVLSDPSGACWYCIFNPWSHENPLYLSALHGSSISTAIEQVNPAYWMIAGYYNEVKSIEAGCSYWTSVHYGMGGAVGAALTVGFARALQLGIWRLGAALTAGGGLANGWRGTNMSAEEAFNYHYGKHGQGVTPEQYAQDAANFAANPPGTGTPVKLADGTWGVRYRTPGGGPGGILDANGNVISFWYG
jgi:RHS repeat-associated protein